MQLTGLLSPPPHKPLTPGLTTLLDKGMLLADWAEMGWIWQMGRGAEKRGGSSYPRRGGGHLFRISVVPPHIPGTGATVQRCNQWGHLCRAPMISPAPPPSTGWRDTLRKDPPFFVGHCEGPQDSGSSLGETTSVCLPGRRGSLLWGSPEKELPKAGWKKQVSILGFGGGGGVTRGHLRKRKD